MDRTPGMSTAVAATATTPPLAAALRARITRVCIAVWRGLESHGRRRAWREMCAVADRYEDTHPELARQLRDANRFIDSR